MDMIIAELHEKSKALRTRARIALLAAKRLEGDETPLSVKDEAAVTGGPVERRRDGSVFPVEVSVRPAGASRTMMVFRDVTDRRAAEQARIDDQLALSSLTQRLMSQERETSRHLAQTLHDHLGQSLAVSRLRLDAVTVAQGHLMTDMLKREWTRFGQSLDQAIADVRLVLGDLRPPMLEEQGLLAALDNEVRVRSLDGPQLDVLLELDDVLPGQRWPA